MMNALIPGTKRPVAIIAPKSLHHIYKEEIARLLEADPSLTIRLVSPRSIHYLKDGDYELVLHEVHEYGRITKQMLERLFSISDRYCARLINRHAMLVSPTMSPIPMGPTLYSQTVKRFNLVDLGHVTY